MKRTSLKILTGAAMFGLIIYPLFSCNLRQQQAGLSRRQTEN
jgi:hypothetical protein